MSSKPLLERYPWSIILARWFFLAGEMGLATYFVMSFRFSIGIVFIAYGVVSVTGFLPLIRCVRCYYYGKRCNFGWGEYVSKFFPRAETGIYASTYGCSLLFWPLRLLPVAIGSLKILDGIFNGFSFVPQGLFGVYLLVIALHRRFYRTQACVRCHQRTGCPVYDSRAMLGNTNELHPVYDNVGK